MPVTSQQQRWKDEGTTFVLQPPCRGKALVGPLAARLRMFILILIAVVFNITSLITTPPLTTRSFFVAAQVSCPTDTLHTTQCDYSQALQQFCRADATSPSCAVDDFCGTLWGADNTTAELYEIVVVPLQKVSITTGPRNNRVTTEYQAFSDGPDSTAQTSPKSFCPGGSSLVTDHVAVQVARQMFYRTSCFIFGYSASNVAGSSVTYGASIDSANKLVTSTGTATYACDGAFISSYCMDGTKTVLRYYQTKQQVKTADAAKSIFGNPVCQRKTPSRLWRARSNGVLFEDLAVVARLTYDEAVSFCAMNSASLFYAGNINMKASSTDITDLLAVKASYGGTNVPLVNFWVGISNGKWSLDNSDIDSTITTKVDSGVNYRIEDNGKINGVKVYKFVGYTPTSTSIQRNHFVCTRKVWNMWVTVPDLCFYGSPCRVTVNLETAVTAAMVTSGSAVTYTAGGWWDPRFDILVPIGSRTATGDISIPSGSSVKVSLDKGSMLLKQNTTAINIRDKYSLNVTIPNRFFLNQPCPFKLFKFSDCTVSMTQGSSWSAAAGSMSFDPFNGFMAMGYFTPTELVSSTSGYGTRKLVVGVTGQRSCGGVTCTSYASQSESANIRVVQREVMGVRQGPTWFLIGSSSSTFIVVSPPTDLSVVYDVDVDFRDACQLVYSIKKVPFVEGQINVAREVTISPPTTPVSSRTTCAITPVLSKTIQYSGFNFTGLSVTLAPFIAPRFNSLLAAMSSGESYTFSISVSDVYEGKTITFAPTCGTSTISPLSASYTSSVRSNSFTISGAPQSSCTFAVAVSGDGAYQVSLSGVTMPYVTFSNQKVITTSFTSPLYVGSSGTLTVSAPFTSSSVTISVTATWAGAANAVDRTSAVLVISQANPSASVTVTALSGSTGQGFTFAMTPATPGYDTVIEAVPSEIKVPVKANITSGEIPAQMSIGAYFATTLTFSIIQLPPVGYSVTIELVYNAAYFSATPAQIVWSGADGVYAAKTITVTATNPTPAASAGEAFSYRVTGTHPQYTYGTFAIAQSKAFLRSTITTVPTVEIYGAGVAYTLMVTVPQAPVGGMLNISITFPTDRFSSNASYIVIPPGATAGYVRLTTMIAIAGISSTFSYSINAAYTPQAVSDLYDPRINTTSIQVKPYLPISTYCNATELYFGPWNAIECTFNISESPPTGSTLTLAPVFPSELSPITSPNAQVTPTTSPTGAKILFQPTTGYTFNDGDTSTITVRVSSDSSRRYNPANLVWNFNCKKLIPITLVFDQGTSGDSLFISNPNVNNPIGICASITVSPTTFGDSLSVSTAFSSFSWVSTGSVTGFSTTTLKKCFTAKINAPGFYTVTLSAMGSYRFAPSTLSLGLNVKEIGQVRLFTSLPPAMPVTFVGSNISFGYSLTIAHMNQMTLKGTIRCNGVVQNSVVSAAGLDFVIGERDLSSSLATVAVSECLNGTYTVTLQGVTNLYDLTQVYSVAFEIRNRKTITSTRDKTSVYGGGVDALTLSWVISALPLAAGSILSMNINARPSNVLRILFPTVEYTPSSNVASLSRDISITCPNIVTQAAFVDIDVTFNGTAANEYSLAGGSFRVTVLPIANVSFNLDFNPAVVYVSPQLTRTMTVSLTTPPSKNIVVTPRFVDGSPTAVRFTPASFIFNASYLSVSFVIEALTETGSSEALSFALSGESVEYFPRSVAEVSYPVKFVPLGKVTLIEAVPSSLFQGYEISLFFRLSAMVPMGEGWDAVGVILTSSSSAISVTPSTVRWEPGATDLQRSIVIKGVSIERAVTLSFGLTSTTPPIYTSLLPSTSVIEVLSARSILWSAPTFVYVGRSVEGTLRIVNKPPAGSRLAVTVSSTDVASLYISTILDFDSSTALTRTFTLTGMQVRPVITLSVAISAGGELYDQPASRLIEVRALELVNATGIPVGGMYVESSVVVSITVSRPPPCDSGSIQIVPSFGTTDGSFAPTSGVSWGVGETSLTKSVTLTASQVTAAPVTVSFPITYSSLMCSGMYSPAVLSAAAVRIYPREVIKLSTWENMTASGVSFVYVNNSVPLTIDLGTPSIRHSGVRLTLAFAGGSGFISFTNTTVFFPPNVNITTVWVTGLAEVSAAAITVQVAAENSQAFLPPTTAFRLRVLKQVRVSLRYANLDPLLVVNTQVPIEVSLDGIAQVGSVTMMLSYNGSLGGPGTEFRATNVSYEERSTFWTTSTIIYFTAQRSTSVERELRLVFFGPAAGFYVAAVPFYMSKLLDQLFVELVGRPSELFIGPSNARTVTLRMKTLPTLPLAESLTVLLTNTPTIAFSPSQAILTASQPSILVTVTGRVSGTAILRDAIAIVSQTREYAPTIANTAEGSTITVSPLLKGTIGGYLSTMYTEEDQTFTVTIPRVPQSGTLVVRPTLATAYNLTVRPPFFNFTSLTPLVATFVITTSSETLLTQVDFVMSASGSPEFEMNLATTTLRVNPATEISFSDFLSKVYIGSTNRFTFSVSIARRPANNEIMRVTFMPNTSLCTFTPNFIEFGPVATHPLTVVPVVVQGISPSGGVLHIDVAMDDPTRYYTPPTAQALEVLALESYSGTITDTVVSQGFKSTVTLRLSKIPVTPMTVHVTIMKNRSSTSMYDADPSIYSVSPAQTLTLENSKEISFDVYARAAPDTVQIGFVTSGASTSQFFILTLPTFVVRFQPLVPIIATLPPKLFVGLPTQIQISIPSAPPKGSLRLTISSDNSITFPPGNPTFDPNSPTVVNLTVTANTVGSFVVGISAQSIDVDVFMSSVTPPQWNVVVENPYPLDFFEPAPFLYAYEANQFVLRVDYGVLSTDETITITLTHNVTDDPRALVIFPTTVVVPQSTAVFNIYSTRPLFARINMTFTSNARRLVLAPRLMEGSFVLNFRPLKTIVTTLNLKEAVVGSPVPISVTVDPAPSEGHQLFAALSYSGSPSNIQLPDSSLSWVYTTATAPRQMVFSGKSPTTNYEKITVSFSNDPQYNMTLVSFDFKFIAKWRFIPIVPIIMFIGIPAPIRFNTTTSNENNVASISVTPSLSITRSLLFMNALSDTPSESGVTYIGMKNTVSLFVQPTREGTITMNYILGGDEAANFATPPASVIQIVSNNTIIIDAASTAIVVYIAPPAATEAITYPVVIRISAVPTNGTLIVTPTLMCNTPTQFVEFTPRAVYFNQSNPNTLEATVSIKGISVFAACALSFVPSGTATGYSGSPQSFTVETRNPHPISLDISSSVVYVGPENRVSLTVGLDSAAAMPVADDILITFTVAEKDRNCISVNPSTLLWARGVMESYRKIAFVEASACTSRSHSISVVTRQNGKDTIPNYFQLNFATTIALTSAPLISVIVRDSASAIGTDDGPDVNGQSLFMFVGGAALDLDATIPSPLDPSETLTVTPIYKGQWGSISAADALWLPSPIASLKKKILLQPLAVSNQAVLTFQVNGPSRFAKTSSSVPTLEIYGPKRILATMAATLTAGQEFTSKVTIDSSPTEEITVTPVWEGQPGALTWTPQNVTWIAGSSRIEEFFRIKAHSFSEPYMFTFKISGSTRYAATAYSGKLNIVSPQKIVSTQLPPELMRGSRYSIGIDIGVLPALNTESVIVTINPQNGDDGIECIQLDTLRLTFTRTVQTNGVNNMGPTEQLVGVTALRVCPPRLITFTVVAPVTQYDSVIIPRTFATVPVSSFSIDWPTALYVGVENQREVVIMMLETFFDELSFANVTITCNGSAVFERHLSWVYGSRAAVSFFIYSNVSEVVRFDFAVTTNALKTPVIASHNTTFHRFISIQRYNLQSQFYVGDANKIRLSFNVSSLPLVLDGTPADEFHLEVTPQAPGVSVQPPSLRWSSDSPMQQFVYIIGETPTDQPVEISFSVTGKGAALVEKIPPSVFVQPVPLLLIHYTAPPSGLYIGAANRHTLNVTVPDTRDRVELAVTVEGETSGFTLTPSTIKFPVGGRTWQTLVIEALYPTSRVSYLRYAILVGPSRMTPRPAQASESVYGIALEPVTRTPAGAKFDIFESQTQQFTISPPMYGLQCTSTHSGILVIVNMASNDTISVTPQQAVTATIECTWPDPHYDVFSSFVAQGRARKRITVPSKGAAYLGVRTGTRIPFTLSEPPLRASDGTDRMFVVQINFNSSYIGVLSSQLSFTRSQPLTQYFVVTGLMLTPPEGIRVNFTYPDNELTRHEYVIPSVEESKATIRVIEKLVISHCAGTKCYHSTNMTHNASIDGYIGIRNDVRVVFRAPQPTLYSEIKIWPDPSKTNGIIFCSQITSTPSCIPINYANPLTITTTVSEVSAYIFGFNPISSSPVVLEVSGPQDYVYDTQQSMQVGLLNLKPLERVIVGVESLRRELYVGDNKQYCNISITAPPNVPNRHVRVKIEVVKQSGASATTQTISIDTQLVSWTGNVAGGVTVSPMNPENPQPNPLTFTIGFSATEKDIRNNYTISFAWVDQYSSSESNIARNFQEAFSAHSFVFDVLPLISFSVLINGAVPANNQQYDMYLGEVNAREITISLEKLPVFATTEATINVIISNPECFAASETQFRFSRLQYPTLTRTVRVWAKQLYVGTNNTVTFTINGPSEYRSQQVYTIRLLGNALLQMKHSLTQDTVAVGADNAISFTIWPPIPSDLTLGSLVTCGEISFTSAELLKWENSMEPKRMTVAGTFPTTATSNCLLQTPIMSGLSATQYVLPPLNVKMNSRARPKIIASPPDGIAGTSVRSEGILIVVSLSEEGFWKWNTTQPDFNSLLKSGTFRISSSRDAGAEPNSIMAFLNRQRAGELGNPFFIATFNNVDNTLTLKMGPHGDYYASARETISIDFTRWAIQGGITLDPMHASVRFEIRGRKESLMGSGGNVLGSGAASAALAGGALSIGAATSAGKLQSIMNSFLCPNPDWRDNQDSIDWSDAPIVVSLGTNIELGTYAGAAFMNLVLIFILLLVHLAVAFCVYLIRKRKAFRDKSFAAARAVVRFPSLMLFPVLFLFQAIISSSIKVVLYSPVPGLRVLCAFLFVIVGFGVPGIVFSIIGPGFTAIYRLREDEDAEKGIVRKKPSGVQFVVRYLFQPTGHWHHGDPYWLHAFGTVFDEFQWRGTQRFQWFVLVDVLVTFVLGLADGIEPEDLTQCYGRLLASVIAFFLQFALVVIYRPYITRFLNGFFVFVYFLQFMSMLLVAIAVLNNTPQYDGVKLAVNLLLFFSCLLMIKSLIDIVMLVNEYFGIAEMFLADDKSGLAYRDLNAKEEEIVKDQVLGTMLKEANADAERKKRKGGGTSLALAAAGGNNGDDADALALGLLDEENCEMEEFIGGEGGDTAGISAEKAKGGKNAMSAFEQKAMAAMTAGRHGDRGPIAVKSEVIFKGGTLARPPVFGSRPTAELEALMGAKSNKNSNNAESSLLTQPILSAYSDDEALDPVTRTSSHGNTAGDGQNNNQGGGGAHVTMLSQNPHLSYQQLRSGGHLKNLENDKNRRDDIDSDEDDYYDDDGDYTGGNAADDGFNPAKYFNGKYRNPETEEEMAEAEYMRSRGLLEVDEGYKSTPAHMKQPRISDHLREYMAINKKRREREAKAAESVKPKGASGRRRRHGDDNDDDDDDEIDL